MNYSKDLTKVGISLLDSDRNSIENMLRDVPNLKEVLEIAKSSNDVLLMALAIENGNDYVKTKKLGYELSTVLLKSISEYEFQESFNESEDSDLITTRVSKLAMDFAKMMDSPLFEPEDVNSLTILIAVIANQPCQ